jgi:hypothetical protein
MPDFTMIVKNLHSQPPCVDYKSWPCIFGLQITPEYRSGIFRITQLRCNELAKIQPELLR